MQTFKGQIEDLVGVITGHGNMDDTALNDWMTTSAKNVLDLLPQEILIKHNQTAETVGAKYGAENKIILRVTIGGLSCKEVPFGLSSQVIDSNSIHLATANNPVYWFNKEQELEIFPTGTQADIDYIAYPTIVASDDNAIANFPNTAEYAVVLGACAKALQNIINDLTHQEDDIEIVQAMQLEAQTLAAQYQGELQRLTGVQS